MAATEHVNQHRLVPASRAPARLRPSSDGGARFTSTEYIPMIATDADEYAGPYDVVPRLAAQTLETAQKLMLDDVTVEGIPSYRTTNVGGGFTVVIAQD